jgi:imidazolonepropionase-like amidohydrolase
VIRKNNILALIGILSVLLVQGQEENRSVIFTGGQIFTAAGKTFENGAIGVKADTISFVGKASDANFSDYSRVEELQGRHVYPGLVATNTTLGLTEIFAVRATRDYREVGDMNPNVRSIIAYNAESDITSTVLENGVLFAQICPRGGTISGTSSVVKLKGWNWEDAVYERRARRSERV